METYIKKITAVLALSLLLVGTLGTAVAVNMSKVDIDSSFGRGMTQLAAVGNNSLIGVCNHAEPVKVNKKMNVVITAYSSTVWQTDDTPFITASGKWVEDGIVANNMLPFGTRIRMPELYGDKVFVVEDRMNSRKGYYHVDVWFPDYYEAKDFGAKITYIEVLEG